MNEFRQTLGELKDHAVVIVVAIVVVVVVVAP